MGLFNRESRLNVRVDHSLRQRVEVVATEMDCSTSMAARYLLGEALAHRAIEAHRDVPAVAEDFLRRVALSEVRAFKNGGTWQFCEEVRGLLRGIGVGKPRG